jgi:hypothetical protein
MESFAKSIAVAVLFIPIALLAIWLDAPWWAFALVIGFVIFACYSAWETDAIPLKGAVVCFGISIVLALASYLVATHMGVSIADLTQDQALSKYVRRLPEYALSVFSFSVSAGVAAILHRQPISPASKHDARA